MSLCDVCIKTRDEIVFVAEKSPRGRKNID